MEMYFFLSFGLIVLLYSLVESMEIDVIDIKLGCDKVVNSGLTIDECGVCGGNGASCEVVEGLFRRETLNLGYNFVVRIPAGASRINITELSKSINYLALNSSNPLGRNYVNGIWGVLDPPKIYPIPGTYVNYKRPLQSEEGESMIIPGPTTEDMSVWLFFQRRNPGIFYEYTVPKSTTHEFDQPASTDRNTQQHRPEMPHRNPMLDIGGNNRMIDGHGGIYPRGDGSRNTYVPPRNPVTLDDNSFYPRQSYRSNSNGQYVPVRRPYSPGPVVHGGNPAMNGHSPVRSPHIPSMRNSNSRSQIRPQRVGNEEPPIEPDLSTPVEREPTNTRREATFVNIQRETAARVESVPKLANTRGNQAVETVVKFRENDIVEEGGEQESTLNVEWVRDGFSKCSKTCAEGRQTVLIKCINKDTKETINDRYCIDQTRPRLIVRKCNRAACPAYYDIGQWSPCSRSCGVGRRSRRILCRQQFPGNFTSVVNPKRCRKLKKMSTVEQCEVAKCAAWIVNSNWSECSVKCGKGRQSRQVICGTDDGAVFPNTRCSGSRPPHSIRTCSNKPCITAWFNSEWGTCSADCDTGVETRDVLCMNTAGVPQGCPSQSKPSDTRSCSRATCGDKYEWFSGAWGPCSTDCGQGTQERRVTCMVLTRDGGMRMADSRDSCKTENQPVTTQSCNTQACGSRWFYTLWSDCSVTCGGGTRDRDVWCLDGKGEGSSTCKSTEKPSTQEQCNNEDCDVLVDPNCKDLFGSCRMVLQARLCSYAYYQRNCCRTCSQASSQSLKLSNKAG